MDESKVGPGSSRSAGLFKKILKKNLIKVCFIGGVTVFIMVVLYYKFHVFDKHFSVVNQHQSEIEEKYDMAISGIKADINYLKHQNAQEEDAIERLRVYISELQSNLTQLRTKHEESILELQERGETDSRILSLIEYHNYQSELLNETLRHVGELNSAQNDDIRHQLNVLLNSSRSLMLQLQENGKNDSELRSTIQHQQHEIESSMNTIHHNFDTLTRKISKVFEQCRLESDTCNIGSRGNGRYWKACPTEFFPIRKKVSSYFIIVGVISVLWSGHNHCFFLHRAT